MELLTRPIIRDLYKDIYRDFLGNYQNPNVPDIPDGYSFIVDDNNISTYIIDDNNNNSYIIEI